MKDYYNFALKHIPKGEWLVKIDADQIYNAQKLKESSALVSSFQDVVFYFRLNLHIFEGRVYLDKTMPISDPYDHWLICNQGLYFKEDIQEEDEENVFSWELLRIPFVYNTLTTNLNTWHFPQIKIGRRENVEIKDFVPLSQYRDVIPKDYLRRIDLDMLDERRILSFFYPHKSYIAPPPLLLFDAF